MPGVAICAPMRRPVAEIENLQALAALWPGIKRVATSLVIPFSYSPERQPCQNLGQTECWIGAGLLLPIREALINAALGS